MANHVDPDQTAFSSSLTWVCSVCSDLCDPIHIHFAVEHHGGFQCRKLYIQAGNNTYSLRFSKGKHFCDRRLDSQDDVGNMLKS